MKIRSKVLLGGGVLVLAGLGLFLHEKKSDVPHVVVRAPSLPPSPSDVSKIREYQRKISMLNKQRSEHAVPAGDSSGVPPRLLSSFPFPEHDENLPPPKVLAIATPRPSLTEISVRVNRLTDIVFPEKILKVILGDLRAGDFKLVGTKVGSENHLIIEPLKKGVISDLFIYGADQVSYLRVRTVADGQKYDFSFKSLLNRLGD